MRLKKATKTEITANVSSLRFTTPADVFVSPENFKLTASELALAALLIASATFLAVAKPSSPVTEAVPAASLLIVERL